MVGCVFISRKWQVAPMPALALSTSCEVFGHITVLNNAAKLLTTVTFSHNAQSCLHSSQPSVSSLWTRRYEEDKSSSTAGSSRSRRTLPAGHDSEEASHGLARKGIYDGMFSSGDVRYFSKSTIVEWT